MGRPRRNWTSQEDELLRTAVNNAFAQSRPLLWRELAKCVPGRTNKACRRRWWNSLADTMAKGPWSETEDERLIGAVRKYGGRWSQVSRVVASRNSDQCSSHWSQVLDPDINYCDWTAHEDDQLLHAVLSYGTNWTTIAASHSPKRTTLALKNRYSTIRLRHKNHETRKVSAGIKSSSSESRTGSIKKKKGKTIKGSEEYNNKGAEEDEEEVEDEDDDGDDDDDDDNDDTEDDDDDSHSLSNATTMADASTTRPKFPNECATIADGNGKPISTASGSWAGFNKSSNLFSTNFFQAGTGNPLEEHLINETPDQLTYLNPLYSNATPLNSREPFFDTMQDTSGMNTGTPFPFYGDGAMNIPLSPEINLPHFAPSTISNPEGKRHQTSALSFSRLETGKEAYGPATLNTGSATDAGTPPASMSSNTLSPALYQVSISMACTAKQLSNLMVGLADAGTCVNIKVDPQSH